MLVLKVISFYMYYILCVGILIHNVKCTYYLHITIQDIIDVDDSQAWILGYWIVVLCFSINNKLLQVIYFKICNFFAKLIS
jgi:hypothetical protein